MLEIHPTQKNEVAWSSWLPALGYALGNSHGPVLEIGIGHFSTPFLHEFCKGAGRTLHSIELDSDWGVPFAQRFWDDSPEPKHRFHLGPYVNIISEMVRLDMKFGVAFIDNSPGGTARSIPFEKLLRNCDFIVVHDYWRENSDAIQPIVDAELMNHRIYSDYEPPTLLAACKGQKL